MIKNNLRFFNFVNMVLDFAVIAISFCAAAAVSFTLDAGASAERTVIHMLPYGLFYAFVFWLSISLLGMYNVDRLYRLSRKLSLVFFAGTIMAIAASVILYCCGAELLPFEILFVFIWGAQA